MTIEYCCERAIRALIDDKLGVGTGRGIMPYSLCEKEASGGWARVSECPFCHAPITIRKAGEK